MKWRLWACLLAVTFGVTSSNMAFAKGKSSFATRAQLISGYISNDDYPAAAKRNEESGTSVALFTVGKNGIVSDCIAFGASPSLDLTTCYLLKKRFIFARALNKRGEAIFENKVQRVTWRLEEYDSEVTIASPIPQALLVINVDAQGKVNDCKIRKSSGDRLWDISRCAKFKADGLFPAYNREGKPVNAIYSFGVPRPNPGLVGILMSLPLPQE